MTEPLLQDEAELRALENRLFRLSALAETRHEEHARLRREQGEVQAFLALAPRTAALLQDLTQALFAEILDEVEANLTHAIREILGQDRAVKSVREDKNNRLHVTFEIHNQGRPEHVLAGQGGSVCNILSVGLRLIALSQLDPERHRPFLVLDEQDCWLKPELVPKFMRIIAAVAEKLGLQALVISHHPLDLFVGQAGLVWSLVPHRDQGVAVAPVAGSALARPTEPSPSDASGQPERRASTSPEG